MRKTYLIRRIKWLREVFVETVGVVTDTFKVVKILTALALFLCLISLQRNGIT